MKSLIRVLLPFLACALSAQAQSDAILRQARAYLGDEASLAAVKSVHYKGKLESSETAADGTVSTKQADIEIIFAKPYYQRIEIKTDGKVEVTALDDYEAWQRIQNPDQPAQWRMTLLDPNQIRRLRANTWENLAFFGPVARGGRIEDFGMVDMDDRKLHKVGFFHSDDIVFYRFFDPKTGRLVVSETDTGARIREEGENRIAGVRFPNKVTTVSSRPDGTVQQVTVNFDAVTVNETFPVELFRVPSIVSR